MRRLALLVALSLLPAAGAEAAARHRVCGPATARTLAQSSQARVFAVYDADHGHFVPYACGRGGDRRRRLTHYWERECYGSSSGCGGLGLVTVTGRFVAYEDFDCCGSDEVNRFSMHILNTRTMRLRFRTRNWGGSLTGIVLRADGASAWSFATFDQARQTASRAIRRFPSCGAALIASGPGVEDGSLRLVPEGISWIEDGTERRAPLC